MVYVKKKKKNHFLTRFRNALLFLFAPFFRISNIRLSFYLIYTYHLPTYAENIFIFFRFVLGRLRKRNTLYAFYAEQGRIKDEFVKRVSDEERCSWQGSSHFPPRALAGSSEFRRSCALSTAATYNRLPPSVIAIVVVHTSIRWHDLNCAMTCTRTARWGRTTTDDYYYCYTLLHRQCLLCSACQRNRLPFSPVVPLAVPHVFNVFVFKHIANGIFFIMFLYF